MRCSRRRERGSPSTCHRRIRRRLCMPQPDAEHLRADQALVAEALNARARAYAPYSRFAVGAAVRTASGRIFHGCNVENAAYGSTICAERVALFAVIAAGAGPVTE